MLAFRTDLAKGFRVTEEAKSEETETEGPAISEVEMDYLERSLKAIDKLENILERAFILCKGDVIDAGCLPAERHRRAHRG